MATSDSFTPPHDELGERRAIHAREQSLSEGLPPSVDDHAKARLPGAGGPRSRRPYTSSKRGRQRVHLFVGGELVAERWTERDSPHPFYEINQVMYDVTGVARTVDPDGQPAFDATLAARRSRYVAARTIGGPRLP